MIIKRRVTSIVLVLSVMIRVAPAYASSLWNLLANRETDSFKIIHVADLATVMARGDAVVFDADPPDIRAQDGIIPGARLLSSSAHYDVATELPPDKTTKLVFYCHNTR